MGKLVWKLGNVLKANGLTARQVEVEAIKRGHRLGENTIYRVNRGDGPKRFDRATLEALIDALRTLTGKPLGMNDLLEYREE
ncbi:hypothetical protein [Deinococcus yavapaiensis]|uniref:Cro/C1-type helix-turn-helix DNA-binding protein n=1 Tax=Deinococcus yavapaiensis KR-236 TaxID=694435 RepID=A0A318SFI9_9DEIO|nr:hypothetical protein [Deinococcus yavapaiensis]PYE55482.1 hypothetical protein DES52_103317 [Deinococcus yavapaiensis KR-236]